MGRRSLVLLVTLLAVGLALVPAAGALIVPKHSIAGASLRDTRAEIKAALGQPLRISTAQTSSARSRASITTA